MAKSTMAPQAPMEPNPKIATRYDYPSIDRPEISFDQKDPLSRSVTNQSDKDSTDINLIMARYEKTGLIPDITTGMGRKPVYGDFSNVGDYHALQSTIAKVNQAFDALPAGTRAKFNHDPAQLIDFLADSANDAEAIKLGLKVDPKQEAWDKMVAADKAKADAVAAAKNNPAPPAGDAGQPGNPAA